jgi:glycosyltransferase involved in cell wall biosynthesis
MNNVAITVIIPTKNEQRAITKCIRSLSAFDQIIVVDSMSTDDTCALAEAAGAEVVCWDWNGKYPKKHQWCLDNLAIANDWVLFVDADERCSPELIQYLQQHFSELECGAARAYDIPISYVFGGRVLGHGHRVVKRALSDRHATTYHEVDDLAAPGMGEQEGHYQPSIEGSIGLLDQPIIHDDPDPISQWVARHNRYSDWEAWLRLHPDVMRQVRALRSDQGQRFDKAPFKPLLFFLYSYVLRGGWRDGRAGFEHAYALAFYYWLIGAKTRELEATQDG